MGGWRVWWSGRYGRRLGPSRNVVRHEDEAATEVRHVARRQCRAERTRADDLAENGPGRRLVTGYAPAAAQVRRASFAR
jgi:hypothetical protein